MSYIGKNIRKIRTVRKLSQAAFAKKFDLARTSVGAYEEGRADPKIDTIIQIANHFGVAIGDLLTKELTVNDVYHFDIFKERKALSSSVASEKEKKVHTEKSIPLVKIKEYKDYCNKCKVMDYISKLPIVEFPERISEGRVRAFELKGSEMLMDSGGMYNGDILITKSVDIRDIELNRVYVFVANHGVFTRRVVSVDHLISLKADNITYDTMELGKNEVLEVWELCGRYTTFFKKTKNIEYRVVQLEKQVQTLLDRLNNLNEKKEE
ncbi:MAG: helix-turn-helix transcriptional regulator [Cytophagales bacterium]|nr:helix-turn-helix transcriptional regulator [Cytophagales bacterium]